MAHTLRYLLHIARAVPGCEFGPSTSFRQECLVQYVRRAFLCWAASATTSAFGVCPCTMSSSRGSVRPRCPSTRLRSC